MELFLIADITSFLHTVVVVLEVAIALGTVIFVHELGHFAVAKWCGVKCEKFYLGFDFGGWKLFSFKRGETEYGIGVFPLGGYVKMLGQDDNPGKLPEEMERAKMAQEHPGAVEPPLDPRSYIAQSVPKRMAIISAGVIMNLIFAVIFATIAYAMGVKFAPAEVNVLAGEAAWKHGVRSGDKVRKANNVENPTFRDLQIQTALARGNEVRLDVEHTDGTEEDITIPLDRSLVSKRLIRQIGVGSSASLVISNRESKETPADPNMPAAKAEPPLEDKDLVVAVNGKQVDSYAALQDALVQAADQKLVLTVERGDKKVDITIPRNPLKRFGFQFSFGPVTAVQVRSPADKGGLKAGDEFVSIDGKPIADWDPEVFPEVMRRRYHESPDKLLPIVVRRDDKEVPLELKLRDPSGFESGFDSTNGMPVSTMGITFRIGSKVVGLVPGSPAAEQTDLIGKNLVAIKMIKLNDTDRTPEEKIDVDPEKIDWAYIFFEYLQMRPKEAATEFYFSDVKNPVKLVPMESEEFSYPRRGFALEPREDIVKADSFGQAISLGFRETGNSVAQVYIFLQKLFDGDISPKAMGGPVTIAKAAGMSAYKGFSELLIFLTMLSANLAVINFLPIPVLDGGHMVFLLYEGIFRRPANVAVMQYLTYAGLFLILGLMVWVFGLDLGIIPRN